MSNIQPLNPYNSFVDQSGKLTRDGYNFLYNLYLRVGGSLSSLNAATLQDGTWQEPGTIGSTTPNTGAFTALNASSLTVTGTTNLGASSAGVIIQGTNTNNNATAGKMGEYITNNGFTTLNVSIAASNMSSISLTAGDWDVTGVAYYTNSSGSTPVITFTTASLSTSSGSHASSPNEVTQYIGNLTWANVEFSLTLPTTRFSLASTTTIYLVGSAGFTSGPMRATGYIRARRVR